MTSSNDSATAQQLIAALAAQGALSRDHAVPVTEALLAEQERAERQEQVDRESSVYYMRMGEAEA